MSEEVDAVELAVRLARMEERQEARLSRIEERQEEGSQERKAIAKTGAETRDEVRRINGRLKDTAMTLVHHMEQEGHVSLRERVEKLEKTGVRRDAKEQAERELWARARGVVVVVLESRLTPFVAAGVVGWVLTRA